MKLKAEHVEGDYDRKALSVIISFKYEVISFHKSQM